MFIKAVSLHQPYASLIRQRKKTIETRKWKIHHRGDLLIVSTLRPELPGFLCGFALCIVNVVDCREMTIDDEKAACCKLYDGAWAWVLSDIRSITPFRCRGAQGIYQVEIEWNV